MQQKIPDTLNILAGLSINLAFTKNYSKEIKFITYFERQEQVKETWADQ